MSLGNRNRIDFAGELGMGGDGSRWDQEVRGMEGESTRRDNWNWRIFGRGGVM